MLHNERPLKRVALKRPFYATRKKKKRKSVRRWLRFKGRSQWREKRFCCARVTWATRFVSWGQARVPELKRPCKIDGNLETASEWCSILYKINETFEKFELCNVLGRYDFSRELYTYLGFFILNIWFEIWFFERILYISFYFKYIIHNVAELKEM